MLELKLKMNLQNSEPKLTLKSWKSTYQPA